jgi:outer membrane protein TolC
LPLVAALFFALVAGCRARVLSDFSKLGPRDQRVLNLPEATPALTDQLVPEQPVIEEDRSNLPVAPPRTSIAAIPEDFWDMSVEEALKIGLSNSPVLRNLGGRTLTNPEGEPTIFDPALQESDPIFGEQAALAQFDATMAAAMNFAKNDNVFNNSILGGGEREVLQDVYSWNWNIEKVAATGTRFTWANTIQHESTSLQMDRVTFNHFWTALTEATIRQPLMQGRGVEFNRIAGPNAQPGFRTTSGVLISRINEDISIAQFEAGVRTYVLEVLNAYWDLNFAYRNYDAAKAARKTAAETWQMIKARAENDLPGGEADKEAQTRELFFLFEVQVESALNGDPRRGVTGVLQAEANLRRLLGLPQSDDRFIRPSDTPVDAKLNFDWNRLVEFALERRVELRSQRWRIKRRELELVAAKNFLLPRLDAVLRWRNNGFGDDLLGDDPLTPLDARRFASAGKDYFSGDHQEWEAGFQFNAPLGYRQAHAAVRNAELALIRERAILDEQRQHILFGLGNGIRQLEKAYNAMQLAYNRMLAAQETVSARLATFEAEAKAANELLDAQQRLAEAQTEFFRLQTDYAIAQFTVQDEAGMLLSEFGVSLSEAPNELCGTADNARRWAMTKFGEINYCLAKPGYVARPVVQ